MSTRTNTPTTRRILALAGLGAVMALTSSTLVGCRKGGIRSRLVTQNRKTLIEIEGDPVVRGRFTAMDVENQNGSITIIASDKFDEATVQAYIPRGHREELESWGVDSNIKADWVVAEHDSGPDRSILRVTTLNSPMENGFQPRVDLVIKTPICDGLLIRNAGGSVDVTGARGAITIESGFAGGEGGRVEVRCAEPIVEPVRITSSSGPVYLVVPPDSRGTIDIESADGYAVFNTSNGRVVDVSPTEHRWTGIWNDGQNPVQLYSGGRDARMIVVDRPTSYSTGARYSSVFD